MNITNLVKVMVPGDIPWGSDGRLYEAISGFFERWIYYGDSNPEAYDDLYSDIESIFSEKTANEVNDVFDECILLIENIRDDPINVTVRNIIESHQYKQSVEGVRLINWTNQQFLYLVEIKI